jgi:2-methylcitrate dehydratase PrpD
MDAIAKFAEHVVATDYDDLPQPAVAAAKTLILDSLGVGLVGSNGPWMTELIASASLWGTGEEARVWTFGQRLPAPAAALCNAYQIHNSEFDCVHEAAVVHPLTVVLAAVLAVAERERGISGRRLISAVVLGVDVACHIAVASQSGLRFFRPGTAGAFAATAGLGKILGFDQATLVNAFSAAYAQLCGTMQAHTEGSMVLGLQIGFNARNAVMAADLAAHGLVGPQNVLEGPFGFYRLFEGDYDLAPVLAELGRTWRITEVAHKPFPSGRATHGVVDGCLELKRRHGFATPDIERIEARVPPLVHHLVGRPVTDSMDVNYARLCTPYVAARALLNDFVGVEDFAADARGDAASQALARRIELVATSNPDANALTPVTVEVVLHDGGRHAIELDTVYGNPAKPLSHHDHLAKFRRNAGAAARPLPEGAAERLIDRVEDLERLSEVSDLVDLLLA